MEMCHFSHDVWPNFLITCQINLVCLKKKNQAKDISMCYVLHFFIILLVTSVSFHCTAFHTSCTYLRRSSIMSSAINTQCIKNDLFNYTVFFYFILLLAIHKRDRMKDIKQMKFSCCFCTILFVNKKSTYSKLTFIKKKQNIYFTPDIIVKRC